MDQRSWIRAFKFSFESELFTHAPKDRAKCGAAGAMIKIDRADPADLATLAPESLHIGERRPEEPLGQSLAAVGGTDARRTETAEALVGLVRREADDPAAGLLEREKEGNGIVVETLG